MTRISRALVVVCGVALCACGTPAERGDGGAGSFGRAGMSGGGGGGGDARVAVEAISWLVSSNRLHGAAALEDALNNKPGTFSKVDLDGDGAPDALDVVAREHERGRAFELRARPVGTAEESGPVVATLLFDREWEFVGSFDGAMPGLSTTPVAAIADRDARRPAATAPVIKEHATLRDLSGELAVQPIAWLVKFNGLTTPAALERAINKTPGKFSHVDVDDDGSPDRIAVFERMTERGRAFEFRVGVPGDDSGPVVATIVFDDAWEMKGWYSGGGSSPLSAGLR